MQRHILQFFAMELHLLLNANVFFYITTLFLFFDRKKTVFVLFETKFNVLVPDHSNQKSLGQNCPGANVLKHFCLYFTNICNKLECLPLASSSNLF